MSADLHELDAVGGTTARCSCDWQGNDTDEAADHAREAGLCGECWGSGTDAYPSLGICRYCGGSGTVEAETVGRAAHDAADAELDAIEAAEAQS